MKTRSISFIFILSFVFLFQGAINAQEDIADELFKEAFPELQKNDMFDPNVTDLSEDQKTMYRGLMQKLDDAVGDLVAFEVGALGPENAKVFEYKKLKKAKKKLNTADLKEKIKKNRFKIKNYMGFKSVYGADEQECKTNIALIQQTTKAQKWKEAYQYWNMLFNFYPRSSSTTYSKGTNIIEYKIENDAANKEKWIDTLMMVYDQRILVKKFGKKGKDGKYKYPEGYILGRKAIDLLKYRKEAVEQAYAIFEKSVKLQGVKSEDATLLTFMQATEGMFVADKIDAAKVVGNYTKILELLEKRYVAANSPITKTAIEGVNKIFLGSDASTCKELVPAFEKKFNANKGNIEELKKIAGMLDAKDCTDSDLFFKVIIEIDKHQPSALTKYGISRDFAKKKEYEKAEEYMNEAIKLQTVDTLKAKYYFVLASYSADQGKKAKAKADALKAISLKSNYGKPYILIATLYASSGCSQLTSPAGELPGVGYWAAIDKLVKAKSVDPSVTDAANRLIGRYSGGFPNYEKAFMIGVKRGQTVRVGCWIGESTKARFK